MKWVIRGNGTTRDVDVEPRDGLFDVRLDGRLRTVEVRRLDGAVASLRFSSDGRSFQVTYQRGRNGSWRIAVGEREFEYTVLTPAEAVEAVRSAAVSGPSRLFAPIPGKVVAVKVAPGDEVVPGQPLIVLEAMKMENELAAELPGRVAEIHVEAGATVDSGELLIELA